MTNWNSTLYDEKHQFVSNYGESLVTLLQPKQNETILDVGCGTGDLTAQIQQSGATVIGVDADRDMITKAQEKYPHLPFHVVPAEQLTYEAQFHAIFSNAAIHWMKDHVTVYKTCYQALQPQGRLVAEFGGADNIQGIVDALYQAAEQLQLPLAKDDFPWTFKTTKEVEQDLLAAQFTPIAITHYERPTPLDGADGLRNWLEMFSQSLLKWLTQAEKAQLYTACETILAPTHYVDGVWVADYWRMRIVAIKA